MPSIGGVSVHRFEGDFQPAGMGTRELGRGGVHGEDVVQVGSRGEVYQIVSHSDYTSKEAMLAAHASMNALRGYVVTGVDNWGHSWSRQLVKDLKVRKRRVVGSNGGLNGGNWLIEAEWTLKAV